MESRLNFLENKSAGGGGCNEIEIVGAHVMDYMASK